MSGDPAIVRWESPPPRARSHGRKDWQPIADELRAKSGEWAVVAEAHGRMDAEHRRAAALASNIRLANIRAFSPKGAFEATSRMIDQVTTVYARHVGR